MGGGGSRSHAPQLDLRIPQYIYFLVVSYYLSLRNFIKLFKSTGGCHCMLSVLRRWFCCCLLIFVIVPVVSHGFGIMSLLCFCSTLCFFFLGSAVAQW